MRRTAAAAIAALLAFAGAGCGLQAQSQAQITSDDDVPFGLLDPDAAQLLPTPQPENAATTPLCFVDGAELVVTGVPLEAPVAPGDAVHALAEPPQDTLADTARTAVSDELIGAVDIDGGVAHVDLRPAITDLGSDEQLLAVAQLVCTLSSRPGVGPVSFTLNGAPVDVPRSDGSLTSGLVSRDDYADLLP